MNNNQYQRTSIQPPAEYLKRKAVVEYCRRLGPRLFLTIKTALLLVGTALTALADVVCVFFVMRQRYIDATGNFTGSIVELLAVSTMTLCAYFLMGFLYKHGHEAGAKVLYGVILLTLALTLWSTEVPYLQQIWAGFSSTSGTAFADNSTTASSGAPFWFLAAGDLVLAFCFTIAGVLFAICKHYLEACIPEWEPHTMVRSEHKEHEEHAAMQNDLGQKEAAAAALGSDHARSVRAVEHACNEHKAGLFRMARESEAIAADPLRTEAEKLRAQAKIQEFLQCVASVDQARRTALRAPDSRATIMGFLFLVLLPAIAAHGQALSPVCRTAPTMQLIVDASGSSPALDPAFIAAVLQPLEQQVRSMPVCSTITITTVGDASQMPVMLRTRVQLRNSREGATMDDIVAGMRRFLLGFPQRAHGHEQGRSELVGGFSDAAGNVNTEATKPNVIVMLSDLVEHSRIAYCGAGVCRLPPPRISLSNTDVTVYGAGLGLSSDRAFVLTNAWNEWLKRAGAKATLHRMF